MNSPSIRRVIMRVWPMSIMTWVAENTMLIISSLSSSMRLISSRPRAGMTAFLAAPDTVTASVRMARRYPSRATMLILPSASSISTPRSMGLESSCAVANMHWRIMFFKAALDMAIENSRLTSGMEM